MYKSLYEKEYFSGRDSDQKRKIMYQQEYMRIMEICGISKGKVLDIGCGTGDFLSLFPDNEWTKFGIEISDHAKQIAETKNINFTISDNKNEFELIIMRGSLQHLDRPMDTLFKSLDWLKPNGWLCILATPNTGSSVYRLFQDLQPLDPKRNFVLFSGKILSQTLMNIGFSNVNMVYPYRETPYASIFKDHVKFVLRCLGIKTNFAFHKNMMECYAKKPTDNAL